MWFLKAPAAVAGLVAITLLPSACAKPYPSQALPLHVEELRQLHNATNVEKRDCAGTLCGFYSQLCCPSGSTCATNANNEAICGAAAGAASGWIYSTYYYTQTDLVTVTSVWSSFVGVATPAATAACGASQTGCGSTCCDNGYYCFAAGTCKIIGGGSGSPGVPSATGIVNPSAPLRPTSSTLIIVTATGSPTATLPFSTPIPTGVNGTLTESNSGGGGLSGGAIAGIVIGVILGIILLLLICFYCCAKAAFDSILAIFGLGKRRRRTHEETTYIEEHHHSGSGAAAGGRRWYGQGSSRPSRPPKKEGGGMGGMLGLGAGLAGLAAVLGMKRRHDRKHHDDKSTTVTDSSYYYSDYTSSSSASSDRRTRQTRHSSRR